MIIEPAEPGVPVDGLVRIRCLPTTRVIDEDIGVRTRLEQACAVAVRIEVSGNRRNFSAGLRRDFVRRLLQGIRGSRQVLSRAEVASFKPPVLVAGP